RVIPAERPANRGHQYIYRTSKGILDPRSLRKETAVAVGARPASGFHPATGKFDSRASGFRLRANEFRLRATHRGLRSDVRISHATWNGPGANRFRLRATAAALRASSV